VSWLTGAVLPFPVLVLLAGWQLRRAEHAEREGRR
jgi:cytochrome oxidase assembly protein ShyY1